MRAHHVEVFPAVDVGDAYALAAHVDLGTVSLNVFDRGEREHAMLDGFRDEVVRRYFGACSDHHWLLPA